MCEEEDGFVDLVLSDVHLGSTDSYAGDQRSVFHFHSPGCESTQLCVDSDGDLVPPRKKAKSNETVGEAIVIVHKGATPLKDVGFQVWRGALILADFLVHYQSSSFLNGACCIEIGCGVGLCGLVLARVAHRVFLTDYSDEILDNCMTNISLNDHVCKHKGSAKARRLDWMDAATWPTSETGNMEGKYCWQQEDIDDLQNVRLIIAADVIYDDDLTDALFNTLRNLLEGGRTLVMALEKRLNFTLEDLDVTAHAYRHFRDFLITDDPTVDWGPFSSIWTSNTSSTTTSIDIPTNTSTDSPNSTTDSSSKSENDSRNSRNSRVETENTTSLTTTEDTNTPNNTRTMTNATSTSENDGITTGSTTNKTSDDETEIKNPTYPKFHARSIPIDFPQYFQYERVKELELWAIKLGT